MTRIYIWKRRWWWTACNPDETLGEAEIPTYIRARTRERLIQKARRRFVPRPVEYEEIEFVEPWPANWSPYGDPDQTNPDGSSAHV